VNLMLAGETPICANELKFAVATSADSKRTL